MSSVIRVMKKPISEQDLCRIREEIGKYDEAYQVLFEMSINVPFEISHLLKKKVSDIAIEKDGYIEPILYFQKNGKQEEYSELVVQSLREYLNRRYRTWLQIGKKSESFFCTNLFVTVGSENDITVASFSRMFYRVRKELGMEKEYGTDSLRKTYAVKLLREGKSEIACRLFNKNLTSLKLYLDIK